MKTIRVSVRVQIGNHWFDRDFSSEVDDPSNAKVRVDVNREDKTYGSEWSGKFERIGGGSIDLSKG